MHLLSDKLTEKKISHAKYKLRFSAGTNKHHSSSFTSCEFQHSIKLHQLRLTAKEKSEEQNETQRQSCKEPMSSVV